MTRVIAILLTALCALGSAAQNVRTCEHTMATTSSGINNPLKEYREINSGSKFIVKYEGDIPESLKGAFEYAVKIWEETLPPTIPITILVKVDKLRGSSSKSISKVNFLTDVIPNCSEWYYDAPITMMKGALMMDYIINGTPIRFEPLTRDAAVIYGAYGEDINITYNKDLLDECSFSP